MRGERAEGPPGPVSVSPRCPWPAAASRRRLLLLACLPALLLGLETGSAPLLTAEPRMQCVNGSREPPDPRRLPTALPDSRGLTTTRPDPRGLTHLATTTTNSSSNDCQCKSWLFHLHNGLVRNIVTQWSLVCNSSWKVHIAKFSLLVGLIFGYLVCGCLADWVGRQLVLVVTVLFVLVFGLTLALSVNVTMFITLRFFEGFSLAGVFLTLYVARIEIAQSNQRFMITMAASFIAMGGQLLTPGLAALCRNWQVLQTVIICPFIFMIPYWCIFPESLSWLLATQQSHAAKDLLLDYARKHQQEPEEDVKEFLSELEKEPPVKAQKVFILKLLSTRILWKHILVLCVTSLAGFGVHNCFVKSMMDQEEGTLANFYAHYYTIEVVGILSCVVMCFLVSLMGRRGTLLVFTIVTALASLLQLGLISNLTTLKEPFSIAFSLVGLFSSHSMGNLSIFICAELTPTVMRAGGLGLVLASAGFGQLTAPIMELHNQKGYFLHHVVFACCTVICIICILLLPESGGRELPVTLQDADVHPRRPLLPSRRSARSLLSHTELKSYSGLASHPPHRDTSSPTANGRSPPANGPSANVNGHSPTANGPSANVNVPSANVNSHSPTVNGPSANVNVHSPTANDPSPNANGPSANANGHT